MSFGKARSRRVEPARRGGSLPLGPLHSCRINCRAAVGGPATAESSTRQGRGTDLELQNPIRNFFLLHTSTKTAFYDPIRSSTAGREIQSFLKNPTQLDIPAISPSPVRWTRCNMAEPTPIFDPPVLENETSAVEAEGSATTTDNGALKENNGQDVTMAGLEESGVKAAKTGADPAVSVSHLHCVPTTALLYSPRSHSPTMRTIMITFTTIATMNSRSQLRDVYMA